ncbi:MAG: DUF805 domain-containing protein, partial [Candidatus Limnocylindria bacterium]
LLYGASDLIAIAYLLLVLVNLIPYLAVSVRRLHDTGRSGWWLLLTLVPFGGFILLVFYAQPTGPDNRWGPGSSAVLGAEEAALSARAAAGSVAAGILPFETAKIELARTGKRRVFVCGRCSKGISLSWNRCGHCGASFDEFPPRDTGQVV